MTRDRERRLSPARLCDADLRAARAHEPPYDAERGAVKLAAALAVVGVAGSVASASAAGAITKGGVSHGLAAKAIMLLALSGAVLTRDAPTAVPPAVELPVMGVFGNRASRVSAPAERGHGVDGAKATPPAVVAAEAPRKPASPPRGPKREPNHFGRELADVAHARALLSADPGAALEAAERPAGSQALAEEREIIAIRALVSLGRVAEAKARARDFVARRPSSPFATAARNIAAP